MGLSDNRLAVNHPCSEPQQKKITWLSISIIFPLYPHGNVGELPPSSRSCHFLSSTFSGSLRRQTAAICVARAAAAVPPAGSHNAGRPLQRPQQLFGSPLRLRTIGPCWVRIAPMGWFKESFETGNAIFHGKKRREFPAKIFRLNQYWET
jgi:hypothetical protein